MATESMSDRREHVRSIGVTSLAALLGVGAAFASAAITGDVPPGNEGLADQIASNRRALAIVAGAILIQFPIVQKSGIYDEDELGPKHYLFITFMTFSLWFVTWGILMTSQYTG